MVKQYRNTPSDPSRTRSKRARSLRQCATQFECRLGLALRLAVVLVLLSVAGVIIYVEWTGEDAPSPPHPDPLDDSSAMSRATEEPPDTVDQALP